MYEAREVGGKEGVVWEPSPLWSRWGVARPIFYLAFARLRLRPY